MLLFPTAVWGCLLTVGGPAPLSSWPSSIKMRKISENSEGADEQLVSSLICCVWYRIYSLFLSVLPSFLHFFSFLNILGCIYSGCLYPWKTANNNNNILTFELGGSSCGSESLWAPHWWTTNILHFSEMICKVQHRFCPPHMYVLKWIWLCFTDVRRRPSCAQKNRGSWMECISMEEIWTSFKTLFWIPHSF